jgi:hypothetical protein
MKQHSVKNCVRTLIKLRDVYNSQLDTSVLVELNTVINDLQIVIDRKESEVKLGTLGLRAIQVIAFVLSVVTNIKDLMK